MLLVASSYRLASTRVRAAAIYRLVQLMCRETGRSYFAADAKIKAQYSLQYAITVLSTVVSYSSVFYYVVLVSPY